jgi:hypothetical protein
MYRAGRKIGLILLACATAFTALPVGAAAGAADKKAPKIIRAEMVDSNGNGLADKIVINYNEAIKHKLDTDGKYPFKVLGPDKASSYRIKKVNGAKGSKLIIVLKENPNGANKPDIKYTKTKSKPVTDVAKNGAKPQVFVKTIGLPLEATEFTLTVNVNGPGKVTSTSAPSQAQQINCGSDCQVTYPKSTDVNLSATPLAQGDAFENWTGDCSGMANACVIPMDANKTVTATFTAGGELLLNVSKTGAGKVTSSPSGIDCGTTCSKGFPKDSTVTLTAVPDNVAGSKFIDWTGACSGVSTTCTVTMDAAKTVTAKFAYVLTVTRTGAGSVTSSPAGIICPSTCSYGFAPGTQVGLSNVPDATSGSSFVSWGNACTGSAACTVTMDSNKTVDALFGYMLTITKQGSGTGTVTSNPNGIDCGATCATAYPAGTSVVLNALQGPGQAFLGWGNACSGTNPACNVTMNSAKTVTADFYPAGPFTLNVTVGTGGSVVDDKGQINCTTGPGADCSGSYPGGTKVKLTATEIDPTLFEFTGWAGGGCSGLAKTCTITMDANKQTDAGFGPKGPGLPKVESSTSDSSTSGAILDDLTLPSLPKVASYAARAL